MLELIASYRQEYAEFIDEDGSIEYDEFVDQENWEDIIFSANKVLDSKKYVVVTGYNDLWNGTRHIDMIIPETTLESIIHTYMNELDCVEVDVYEDKVEFVNHLHDGTNRYTFIPIFLEDLKKVKLLDIIDNDDELFKEYYGKAAKYANKQELINFIEYEDLI